MIKGKSFRGVMAICMMAALLAVSVVLPGKVYSAEAVIDNTDSGFSVISGTWNTSTTTAGYYGVNYRLAPAGSGASKARWTPDLSETGNYAVYVWYTSASNRASNAPYTIHHSGGDTTVYVNQKSNGGLWRELGVYHFDAGTAGFVELTDDTDGYAIADAVKFVPVDITRIVDNTDDGFSVVSGTWNTSTTTAGYYGVNYRLAPAGSGTGKVRWTPNVLVAGDYNVYVWYTAASNRASDATYFVHDAAAVHTVQVNQKQNGGKWVFLGSYPFNGGSGEYIELTDQANGYAIADAVKLSPVTLAAPANLTVQAVTGSHFNLSWNDPNDDETGYVVERKKSSDTYWTEIGRLPADTVDFQSTGVLADTLYDHRVVAVKDAEVGAYAAVYDVVSNSYFSGQRAVNFAQGNGRRSEGGFSEIDGVLYHHFTARVGGGDSTEANIVRKYSSDSGSTWTGEEVVFSESGYGLINPTMLELPNGKIALTYGRIDLQTSATASRVIRYFPRTGALAATPENLGDPDNWSDPDTITDGAYSYNTGSNDRMILMSDGSLLVPVLSGNGAPYGTDMYRLDSQYIDEAADNPAGHWVKTTPVRLTGGVLPGARSLFTEASVVEWDPANHPGELLALGRTETGWYYESRSDDFGLTWSSPVQSTVTAPIATPYLKKIPDSPYIVLVWNPNVDPTLSTMGSRSILASMISGDGGRTWENYKQIEYYNNTHSFSYPSVFWEGGYVHLAYHKQNRNDYYARLDEDWFTTVENVYPY